MKTLLLLAAMALLVLEMLSSISIQTKLEKARVENENLSFQLSQCRILYRGM